MRFSVSNDFWQNEALKFFEMGKLNIQDGVIYLGGKAARGTAQIFGLADVLFAMPDKYHPLANEAIENGEFDLCNIAPMRAAKLCLERKEKLTEKAYQKTSGYLKLIRDAYIGDELDFVGVNDNFPLGALYTVMVMGELFADKELKREAEKRFYQASDLLKRRGVMSEYNSGYTPFQLYLIANIEKAAPCEEWRQIAKKIENRIWFDLIAHFHPALGTLCGPFSREYLAVGERETMNYYFYALFNPEVQIEVPDYGLNFENLMFLSAEYECDDTVFDLMKNRIYPFEFKAKTECSASTDSTPESAKRDLTEDENVYEYSAGESGLYTYMTDYYGIGTATKEWHSGVQTSSFTLSYKRCENPKKLCDVREIFCRYLINDENTAEQRFFEQGRKTAFGYKNRAVVIYKPKIAAIAAKHYLDDTSRLAQHYRRQEISGNIGVLSAKLVLEIPLCGKMPDEIIVAEKKITALNQEFDMTLPVFIKDGAVYLAVLPLHISDRGRKFAMSVNERDGRLEIAYYNYQGEARDFARRDFLHIRNGFAFSISSNEEINSFDEFVEKESKTIICDRLISTVHSRQTIIRHVEVTNGETKLEAEVSPASEGIKYISHNGFEIEYPKLYATGFDVLNLPYMKKD